MKVSNPRLPTVNRRTFIAAGASLAASSAVRPARAKESGNYNIAIVGAGLFGSAAARHLSKTHDDVVLVGPSEPKNPGTHDGVFASHYDQTRLVRGVDPDINWALLAKHSIARFRELESVSGIRFYHDVGYMMVTPGGLGEDWFNLPAMRQVAKDTDVNIINLDYTDLTTRYPFLHFTPSSTAVLQGEDAGHINPRQLLRVQQKLGELQGMTLIQDIVADYQTREDQVELRLGSGETIRANRVLVATGAYTNASGLLRRRLKTLVRAAMIMETEVAANTPAQYPTTLYAKTDGEEDFWGLLMPPIQYPDGRTILKTMDGYYGPAPLVGYEALNEWSRGKGHTDHHPVLTRALREVFPSLEVASTEFKPCLITDTNSGFPYIDMLNERIGFVAGGNGKSAKSSDEIGRIAAAMIGDRDWASEIPQSVFAAEFE